MKNLMTYLHPSKGFTEDYSQLVKVQIDNSLRRWKPRDIILATNFPYEYRGVEAIVLPDSLYCEHRKRASKINAVIYLIENRLINGLTWFHDFDAFQLEDLPEDVLGDKEVGFTNYGFNKNWNTGSFFFTPKAIDIFVLIKEEMDRKRINEEQALGRLTRASKIKDYALLNNTYNLGQKWSSEDSLEIAEKPIKVLHFHPKQTEVYERVKPMISKELMEIFKKHGY